MGNAGILYTDKNEIGETERQRERESERQTIYSRGKHWKLERSRVFKNRAMKP